MNPAKVHLYGTYCAMCFLTVHHYRIKNQFITRLYDYRATSMYNTRAYSVVTAIFCCAYHLIRMNQLAFFLFNFLFLKDRSHFDYYQQYFTSCCDANLPTSTQMEDRKPIISIRCSCMNPIDQKRSYNRCNFTRRISILVL